MLTWTVPNTTTDRQTIRAVGKTQICRSVADEMKQCGTPVGSLPPSPSTSTNSGKKILASYADTIPSELQNANASGFLTYGIEVLNHAGRGAGLSNLVRVPLAPTLPPPQDFHARVTREGIVLSWMKPVSPESEPGTLRFLVRILRREEGSQQQTAVGQVPIDSENSLTDSNIDWEKTYEYHAEVVTIVDRPNGSEIQIEGDDTADVKVFAHDVFPPAVPSGLQAVFSGAGQAPFIDLVWAPVADADLAGYNVYRREEGTEPVKINPDLLKTPAYRDAQVSSRGRYFYSVTSVDVRGNESSRSEEASEFVP